MWLNFQNSVTYADLNPQTQKLPADRRVSLHLELVEQQDFGLSAAVEHFEPQSQTAAMKFHQSFSMFIEAADQTRIQLTTFKLYHRCSTQSTTKNEWIINELNINDTISDDPKLISNFCFTFYNKLFASESSEYYYY